MTNYMKDGRIWGLGLVLLGAMLLMQPVQAQNRAQRSSAVHQMYAENHMVSLVPIPVFFDGFRVDYDVRVMDNLWLNVAPQLNYRRKLQRPAEQYQVKKFDLWKNLGLKKTQLPAYTLNQTGVCLDLNLRYYHPHADGDQRTKGLYYEAGIGLEYNQFSRLNSKDEPYEVTTTRLGSQAYIGYMWRMWPKTTFDFYFGGAWRYAIHSFSQPEFRDLMNIDPIRPWSYLYSGVFLEAGLRIGFVL